MSAIFKGTDQDYRLPVDQTTDRSGSGNEEDPRTPWCTVALCCIALSGMLAAGALAGASLGYEVGLKISIPQVPFNTSVFPVPFNTSVFPVPSINTSFLGPALEGMGFGDGGSSGRMEARGDEPVERPGPTVEEITPEVLDREDAEWEQHESQWKEEEEEWRSHHAVNKTVFYMYRAQSSHDYPPVNINTADLGGVLWYLHNEVVRVTPRKFHISRILRFKVTVKGTAALRHETSHEFGPFVAFDSGKCTVPTCDQIWNRFGFVVGCQVIGAGAATYSRQKPCNPATCQGGIWYSLPGPCPSLDFRSKSRSCKAGLPGGECGSSNVTGKASCTYHAEQAGWVDANEFMFINNYTAFIAEGRREYDPNTDRGVRFSFWDGMRDQRRCIWRMNRLQLLFKRKYPEMPALLDPPPCL
uniref:Uncharacterized protein n=1 Tax=Alexandrium monilatum TaxID=311494 RepID=A0A7S4VE85_9DINO